MSHPLRLLHLLRLTVLTSVLLTVSSMAQAPEDVRVALVIGNAAYVSVPALRNAVNDAKAMGDTLRKLGFTVIEVRDGSKAQMTQALAKVREALNGKQGVGMLYYAGHGLQIDARNYMVPVDAKISKAGDVARQTVDVSGVVDAFKAAGNRMNILVLDACRDNPFGGITSGKGLAPLDAPSGTFLAYATAPGNVAEDGDVKSGNGLYTQYLLQELNKPQSRIEDVFKRVRFSVRKASNGRQIPWESTSLEDDFHFNDGKIIAMTRPTPAQLQAEFNQEKVDWDRIKDSKNPDDFYAFIQKYPNGTITEAAQGRLNQLTKLDLVVQGAGADGTDQAYIGARFGLGDEYEMRHLGGPGVPGAGMSERYKVARVTSDEVEVDLLISVPGSAPTKMTVFYTPDGANLGNNFARYDQPQYMAPGGLLQVGRQWRIGYAASNGAVVTGEGKVLAREKITVPAGTYDTFKVRNATATSVNSGNPMKTICTVWVSPKLPTPVRTHCTIADGSINSTSELTRFVSGT